MKSLDIDTGVRWLHHHIHGRIRSNESQRAENMIYLLLR